MPNYVTEKFEGNRLFGMSKNR